MDINAKKIVFLAVILLVLEIPLLFLWSAFGNENSLAEETAETQEILISETEIPFETETVPETSQSLEIIEQETTIPETTAPETEPTESQLEETQVEESPVLPTEAQMISIDEVPQYFQNDYPEARYGTSTIAKSGSAMTALAMVASYMTDHYYYPDEVADNFAHYIGNHYERLQYGAEQMQLCWKRARDIREVLQSVKDGKIVIALMNAKSVFPSDHHYIVLTGVNEAGKITLLDPNKDHYTRQGIDDYLENGIDEKLLFSGFEGGWIFDKSQMPEDPYIYEPEPYARLSRYPGLELTDAELKLMVDVICMEGASEPFEGQQAIAEVILNRLVSGNFQSSVYGIVHAVGQFPSVSQLHRAKPTYTQYKAVERALKGPYVLPIDVVFYAKFAVNNNVWGKIGAHTFCYSY